MVSKVLFTHNDYIYRVFNQLKQINWLESLEIEKSLYFYRADICGFNTKKNKYFIVEISCRKMTKNYFNDKNKCFENMDFDIYWFFVKNYMESEYSFIISDTSIYKNDKQFTLSDLF